MWRVLVSEWNDDNTVDPFDQHCESLKSCMRHILFESSV